MADSPARLLESFIEPFLAGRFDDIADHYDEPLLFVRPYESHVYHNRSAFNVEVAAIRNTYIKRGLADVGMEVLSESAYAPGLTSIDIRWTYRDARGRTIATLYTTYILRHTDLGLKVAVHISHNEHLQRPLGER